ncbi:GPW/gp25 family protein [Phocaeicola dorei]|uniref:GPW/gp25 family protein n=1 Tax=Phocaeicola dorei TaxID=357276 RepID=UPI001875ECB5|nr:GPW/gp25 family protein [Phocaeicola dorei]MBE5080240.1 GPW/gp25 family protein [Phocaeicola dorei]
MNKDRTFLGRGWSFPPALGSDGMPTRMVSGEENIEQSLLMLLGTSPGERVHRYDYGCPIRRYAFEVMDITTQTLLRDEIERAVVMFEPRVDLHRVDFETDDKEGILKITLDYTIRQTNRRTNMVYPFYLNEGTDLLGLQP